MTTERTSAFPIGGPASRKIPPADSTLAAAWRKLADVAHMAEALAVQLAERQENLTPLQGAQVLMATDGIAEHLLMLTSRLDPEDCPL